jgi:spore maturation protein CgeB
MRHLRVLHFGSYWMGVNDIVFLMQRCLARLPQISSTAFDVRLYDASESPYVLRDGHVNWLRDEVVESLITETAPDVIICNAGGISPTPGMHQRLASKGIRRVGIALSDPDDFTKRSRRFAGLFDRFYTNAVSSLNDYGSIGVNAKLLPFAADAQFHRPLRTRKKWDVVVVGGMRPERQRLVQSLRRAGLTVGCYGSGWPSNHFTRFPALSRLVGPRLDRLFHRIESVANRGAVVTEVHGRDHVVAINSGHIYLSFSKTAAGYTNVKVGVFEAAACAACILVDDFEEICRYFEPEVEVVTYRSEEEAVELATKLSQDWSTTRRIGNNACKRILKDHTWERRWEHALREFYA